MVYGEESGVEAGVTKVLYLFFSLGLELGSCFYRRVGWVYEVRRGGGGFGIFAGVVVDVGVFGSRSFFSIGCGVVRVFGVRNYSYGFYFGDSV